MHRNWILWFAAAAVVLLVTSAGLAEQAGEQEEREGEAEVEPGAPADAEALSPEERARRAEVIAVVNGAKLTIGEFEDRLNKQGPFRRAQYGTPEKRREFLEQMIEWELQAQEARRRDLHEDESVSQQVKRVMSSLLLRREVDDRVRPEDVSDQEIRAYYDEHISTFKRPERVRAYHIVVADREKAQGLLDRIRSENVDTREFRRLAREMSEDDETKRRGGDLRYFTRPDERGEEDPEVHPAIVKAAFELLEKRRVAQKRATKAGPDKAVAGGDLPGFDPVYPKLVQTPEGYNIVRFMGHREAVDRSYDDVERQIRNRIWREKLQTARETFVSDLREKHRVVLHDETLDLVKVDAAPMPVPEGGSKIRPRRMPGPPGPPISGPEERGPSGRAFEPPEDEVPE